MFYLCETGLNESVTLEELDNKVGSWECFDPKYKVIICPDMGVCMTAGVDITASGSPVSKNRDLGQYGRNIVSVEAVDAPEEYVPYAVDEN